MTVSWLTSDRGPLATSRSRYARVAWAYDLLDWPFEPLYRRGRALIGAASADLTVEVGAGTGKNFPYYAPSARVIASDLSWPMLSRARRRQRPPVRGLLLADAARLPIRTGSVETVVATFVCCVQADPRPALAEIGRVLRPRGRALFMECVLPRRGALRGLMLLVEPVVHGLYGVRWDRDLAGMLPTAGLRADEVRPIWGNLVQAVFARRTSPS